MSLSALLTNVSFGMDLGPTKIKEKEVLYTFGNIPSRKAEDVTWTFKGICHKDMYISKNELWYRHWIMIPKLSCELKYFSVPLFVDTCHT